ncbi:MAG: hypothetical protein CFE22_11020 [Cytophagaceae bacterium BCCC1]|nr:MAG: hypothetical protein CFE22_11020 [Cytophagaceae bacterium BCCC1]
MANLRFTKKNEEEFQNNIIKARILTEKFHESLKPLVENLAKINQAFQESSKYVNNIMKPLTDFSEKLKELVNLARESAPENIKKLADYGWYLPFSSSILQAHDWANYISEDKSLVWVEQQIINLIDRHQHELIEELFSNFPERKGLIESALKAHHYKDYNLSIPVFLSQSDGICKKITGYAMFSGSYEENGEKHLPNTRKWANQQSIDSLYVGFLEPLKTKLGFNKYENSKDNYIGFTRHSVLHGESLEYGTEVNSYKAMCLLFYIGYLVNYLVNE